MDKGTDSKGVPYVFGNRHDRRFMQAGAKRRTKQKPFKGHGNPEVSREVKLPRELWEKGKSKFLVARLLQEKKQFVGELY